MILTESAIAKGTGGVGQQLGNNTPGKFNRHRERTQNSANPELECWSSLQINFRPP